jgi:hypothetical protein
MTQNAHEPIKSRPPLHPFWTLGRLHGNLQGAHATDDAVRAPTTWPKRALILGRLACLWDESGDLLREIKDALSAIHLWALPFSKAGRLIMLIRDWVRPQPPS